VPAALDRRLEIETTVIVDRKVVAFACVMWMWWYAVCVLLYRLAGPGSMERSLRARLGCCTVVC